MFVISGHRWPSERNGLSHLFSSSGARWVSQPSAGSKDNHLRCVRNSADNTWVLFNLLYRDSSCRCLHLLFVKETKGLSLEEIEILFARPAHKVQLEARLHGAGFAISEEKGIDGVVEHNEVRSKS